MSITYKALLSLSIIRRNNLFIFPLLLCVNLSFSQKKIRFYEKQISRTKVELSRLYDGSPVRTLKQANDKGYYFYVTSNKNLLVKVAKDGFVYEYEPHTFIIEYDDNLNSIKQSIESNSFVEIIDVLDNLEYILVKANNPSIIFPSDLKNLLNNPQILSVSLNGLLYKNTDISVKPTYQTLNNKYFNNPTYNVPHDTRQWHLLNTSENEALNDIDGLEALALIKKNNYRPTKEIIIAVLDTGIDDIYQTFNGQLWTNTDEIAGNYTDDDNNGKFDDIHGWNFVDNNPTITDLESDAENHGTHVSGIIGVKPNNKLKTNGVFQDTKILTCRVIDTKNNASIINVISAIEYCIENNVDVINMSIGGLQNKAGAEIYRKAIEIGDREGIFFVASAGNDKLDLSKINNYYPCQAGRSILCVANSDKNDQIHSSSNFESKSYSGLPWISIAAPGTDIYSTIYGGFFAKPLTGTSMSAPMVSGTVGLLKSIYPFETNEDVFKRIVLSADKKNRIDKVDFHVGRLNIAKAIMHKNGDNYCTEIRKKKYPFANSGELNIDGSNEITAFAICSKQQLKNINLQPNKYFKLMTNLENEQFTTGEQFKFGISNRFTGVFNGNNFKISKIKSTYSDYDQKGLFKSLGNGAVIHNLILDNVEIKGGFSTLGILADKANGAVITNVRISGNITQGLTSNANVVGGIIGTADRTDISYSYFEGSIEGKNIVGGIVGYSTNSYSTNNNHFNGKLNGQIVGGITGYAQSTNLSRNYANHTRSQGDRVIGGISGIACCKSSSSDSHVQGILETNKYNGLKSWNGSIFGTSTYSKIQNNYAVVFSRNSNKQQSLIGQIFDFNFSPDSNIMVICSDQDKETSKVSNSYFLNTTNEIKFNNGLPKSLNELKNRNTFNGWFFSNVNWKMNTDMTPSLNKIPLGLSGETLNFEN